MSLSSVSPGPRAPEEVNVVIEIPAATGPVKYEVDKVTGAIFVDRFMATPMFYPCNYGYVPETLAEDGDPADVLVVTPYPLLPGSVIVAKPVGVLRMEDESGYDAKILAVPPAKLTAEYADVRKSPTSRTPCDSASSTSLNTTRISSPVNGSGFPAGAMRRKLAR
jgi:inorganic pyrophosphatase